MRYILIVMLCCMGADHVKCPNSRESDIEQSVAEAIHRLPAQMDEWNRPAVDRLRELPSDIVVPALINALNDSTRYQEENIRLVAYHLLVTHRAGLSNIGLRQLLRGIEEGGSVRAIALDGLRVAPLERYPDVVEAIAPLLESETDEFILYRVLELLWRAPEIARPQLPMIVRLFNKPDTPEGVRIHAVTAIAVIGDLERVLSLLELCDPGECSVKLLYPVLAGLNRAAQETAVEIERGPFSQWQFFPSEPEIARLELRRIAGRSTQHPNVMIRRSALQLLWPAYGHETVVRDEGGGLIVNPELAQVVRQMIEREPNPELRTAANQLLSEALPRMVKRARVNELRTCESGDGL